MSFPLDMLFKQVEGAIRNHSDDKTPGPGYDSNPLLGALQGMFNQHAQQSGQQYNQNSNYDQGERYQQDYGNVLPASADPYGDPADQQGGGAANASRGGQFGNVLPASADPQGDPADQAGGARDVNQNANNERFGNVLPASADPYGDPADQ